MSDTPLSLAEKLEHRVARLLFRLPHSVQVRLSGQPPLCKDGLTLHPELQLLLAIRARKRVPRMSALPPAQSRQRLRRDALVHMGDRIAVRDVRDLKLETEVGVLPARHYVPPSTAPRPLLVFLHGGGFVLGDLETHDSFCRLLCRESDLHVLAIDYRLAPEHPFPAAVEDALAAFRWAVANAKTLGADGNAVAVGGDSAGGNLAAVVAQVTAKNAETQPALQLLIYPAVDRATDRPSLQHFADGFFLTRADIDWFTRHYVSEQTLHGDHRAAPIRCERLHDLAPALVITAGFDPLRDEGEAYAELLSKSGTKVTVRRFDEFIHGFINMVGVSPACRNAVRDIAAMVQSELP